MKLTVLDMEGITIIFTELLDGIGEVVINYSCIYL